MDVAIYSGTDVTPGETDGAQANASGRELDLFKLALLIRKNLWRIFFFAVVGFLVGLMMALTTISQSTVSTRMAGLRTQMGSIQGTAADNPLLAEFARLHSISMSLESGVLLAGFAAMYLMVRELVIGR